jgi:hypothetical protein
MELKIVTHDGFLADQLRRSIEDLAVDQLQNVNSIIEDFIEGSIGLF